MKLIILFTLCLVFISSFNLVFGEPVIFSQDLMVEKYVPELCCSITTMTFVEEDILILQKDNGQVRLIKDGVVQEKPVLDVNVDFIGEKGMLGITSVESFVYLYFTEAEKDGGESLGNKIYKYEWDGNSLVNPILLKELPSNISHNGGAMVADSDGNVFAVIGDTLQYGLLQNKPQEWLEGSELNIKDNGVIFQLETEKPYYAMGIRNSFGLAIDPVTGNLWDTENGDDNFDEINLIREKFNSGWIVIMGPAKESDLDNLPGYEDYVYEDPKFSWEKNVAPTGLTFAKFKETSAYDNSLFVGDCNNGNIYNFQLNENRDGFDFSDPALQDKVLDKNEMMDEIIIGTGFGCITDIERGPDGFLYVASLSEGVIYRIIPKSNLTNSEGDGGCLIATAAYGSELAPQVQSLREIRDGKVMTTTSGAAFMKGFNQFYYSFSPYIADYERESPVFKEIVKIGITPMVSSLSIMNNADKESEILLYGIGVILLNIGMYFVVPAMVIYQFSKKF